MKLMPLIRGPMLLIAVHESHRRRHVVDAQRNALLRKTYYLLVCMIATARALLSWQVFLLPHVFR